MRILLPAVSILALSACVSPEVGSNNQGVGFGSYELYQRQQAYINNGRPTPAPQATAQYTPTAPIETSAPAAGQDLERNRAQYASAGAAPAPSNSGSSKSNVAAFALATTHPIGTQMYNRSNPFRNSRFERACAKYASDSLAQEAFLAAGGPERDRQGLDPDGDGYACRWDPAAFRLARG